jgi:hypothetical protein
MAVRAAREAFASWSTTSPSAAGYLKRTAEGGIALGEMQKDADGRVVARA